MKSFGFGYWFSILSCFFASPLGVTRVSFSCVCCYNNKWLVWLHCGIRNIFVSSLRLSFRQVFSRLCFTTPVNSDARYFSEADNWSGWTLRGGILFSGYGGTPWDLWAYAYVICLNNWFLAGDGWCDVMILRCLRWFYFGSKIMSLLIWRKECGVVTLLGSLVRDGVVYAVRFLIVDEVLTIMVMSGTCLVYLFVPEKHFGTRSWRGVGGFDELNQQGWNVSFFGYMALNGFSALCIWYGFDSKMVYAETSEVEVEFGVMRFILMSGVYFDPLYGKVSVYLYIVICLCRQFIFVWLCRRAYGLMLYDVIWSIWLDGFLFCTVSIWTDVTVRFPGDRVFLVVVFL